MARKLVLLFFVPVLLFLAGYNFSRVFAIRGGRSFSPGSMERRNKITYPPKTETSRTTPKEDFKGKEQIARSSNLDETYRRVTELAKKPSSTETRAALAEAWKSFQNYKTTEHLTFLARWIGDPRERLFVALSKESKNPLERGELIRLYIESSPDKPLLLHFVDSGEYFGDWNEGAQFLAAQDVPATEKQQIIDAYYTNWAAAKGIAYPLSALSRTDPDQSLDLAKATAAITAMSDFPDSSLALLDSIADSRVKEIATIMAHLGPVARANVQNDLSTTSMK